MFWRDKTMGDSGQQAVKTRPSLAGRIVVWVNVALISVLGAFMVWDYYVMWGTHISEKKIALEEEAQILLASCLRLKEGGLDVVQNYINETCGVMQESTSPGHHIAVEIGSTTLQAHAHHRASPEILSAMKRAAIAEAGLAGIGQRTIVVGTARKENVVVYISEYLSNIKRIIRSQVLHRIASIFFVGLVLAAVLNLVLHQFISRPLRRMISVVQQFSQGKLETRMPNVDTRELGLLADEFDRMASVIETTESQRRSRMKRAQMIQRNLLPDVACINEVRIACLFRPAAEVGGDYYDIIQYPDQTLLFCVADVSGHDVPAAMGAAMLKTLFQASSEQESAPEKLIHLIHSGFSQVTLDEDFATMILARWNPKTRILKYVSAGHETAYLMQSQGTIQELTSTGPILGIQGLTQWSSKEISVVVGDRLVMLTDGLSETRSPKGEMFGRKRITEILNMSCSDPLNTLCQRIIENITSFQGQAPQTDDITVFIVEF